MGVKNVQKNYTIHMVMDDSFLKISFMNGAIVPLSFLDIGEGFKSAPQFCWKFFNLKTFPVKLFYKYCNTATKVYISISIFQNINLTMQYKFFGK